MDFRAAFQYPFKGANKWANLGLVLVCLLIPYVGPVAVIGYQMLMEKRLIEDLESEPPKFEFGRFVDYLKIGLWPFLVSLVLMLPLMMIAYVPVFAATFGLMIAFPRRPAVVIGGVVGLMVVLMFMNAILTALVQPLVMKAGLEQTFEKAFSWSFFKSWWQKVGWLSLAVMLAFMGIWLGVLILTACTIIGPYLLMPVAFFVQAHAQAQLYRLYLARGGAPLMIQQGLPGTFPVTPSVPTAPPVVPPV